VPEEPPNDNGIDEDDFSSPRGGAAEGSNTAADLGSAAVLGWKPRGEPEREELILRHGTEPENDHFLDEGAVPFEIFGGWPVLIKTKDWTATKYPNGRELRQYADGRVVYLLNGLCHREDGPAVEWASGVRKWYLNGLCHREDGPAVEWADGTRKWYLNGQFHRADGPAIERADGSRLWFLNGQAHREDGPAVEQADGTRKWLLNDQLHREDGPAVEWAAGTREWYRHGKRHRKDGPAIEWDNGEKEWWVDGVSVGVRYSTRRLDPPRLPLND